MIPPFHALSSFEHVSRKPAYERIDFGVTVRARVTYYEYAHTHIHTYTHTHTHIHTLTHTP